MHGADRTGNFCAEARMQSVMEFSRRPRKACAGQRAVVGHVNMQGAVAQNWFATLALLAWPVVALWLYQTRPINQATLWTILGGYLLLPVGASIKLAEGIPQLDKISIPSLAALAGCFFFARRPLAVLRTGFGLAEVFWLALLIGPLVTSALNNDPVVSGAVILPGVGAYDGLSAIVGQFLFMLPFFLGRQLLRNSADIEETLRTLVIAGLLYSLPMLFEIRMSPQLHRWLYGYHPTDSPPKCVTADFGQPYFWTTAWSWHSL